LSRAIATHVSVGQGGFPRRTSLPRGDVFRCSPTVPARAQGANVLARLPKPGRRCDNAQVTGLSVALANLKPGTGKTTSAVWLAHVFAQAGNSVLLVDADPAGSALEWSDLAAMYPRLAPLEAAFPFRIVALPSRELHRRLPEIAQADDVVIIDTPQLEDHASIARSALRYADEILIPCAPSPIEINRTTPVRDEISDVVAIRDRPARSAVLLNRCIARAHSTHDAREALERLGYDVLGTAVPRLEVYAQSFGMPIKGPGRNVWNQVARELIERCVPLGSVRI
jgi:chromosome partitioning protein